MLRLAAGRPAEAARDLLELVERENRRRALSEHLAPYHEGAASSLRAAGRLDDAGTHLDRAIRPPAPGARRASSRAHCVCGLTSSLATLTAAATGLDGSDACLEAARVRRDLGARSSASVSAAAGGGELRYALDLAHRCGARELAEDARGALIAAGYRPRRAAVHGPDSLIGGERRVVQLAVQGNRTARSPKRYS